MSNLSATDAETSLALIRSLQQSLDRTNAILVRLDSFLEQADARSALIKSTGDLDAALASAIVNLRENSLKQLESVREASVRYDAVLRDVVDSLGTGMQERLKNLQAQESAFSKLNQLDTLSEIKAQIADIRKIIQSGNNQLNWEVANLTEQISNRPKAETRRADTVSPRMVKFFMVFVAVCLLLNLVVLLIKA